MLIEFKIHKINILVNEKKKSINHLVDILSIPTLHFIKTQKDCKPKLRPNI
jgi:hypothetical protein